MVQEPSPGANRVNEPSGPSDDTLLRASAGSAEATAAETGRSAQRKAERARATAAQGLDTAANAVNAGGARVASAARSAADALASSAHYVREHEARDMLDDAMEVVKSNPGPALLGAVALGFLIGRALSRD
jgi:ElaB/YqjD/DUF883 family membrane-anchored ribosome-binding protein